MKRIMSCLAVLLALGGCATQEKIAAVPGETFQPAKSEKIAISYSLVSKRINYLETLYRVLWLETKTSSQDFSGIWSADSDLTRDVVNRMHQQGFTADSVYDAVPEELISAANKSLAADCLAEAAADHPEIPGTKMPPIADFFIADRQNAELNTLNAALKDKGYRYLVQLTAMDVYGNAVGYGMVIVAAYPNARVIDLQTNRVVWNQQLGHQEVYQLGGSLKALEANDMSKTKDGLAAGVNKIDFATMWGLATPK